MNRDFLAALVDSFSDRRRRILGRRSTQSMATASAGELLQQAESLISIRGEASGTALARALLDGYSVSSTEERLRFLNALAERFGPDRANLDAAIERYRREPDALAAQELHEAAEPRRQELIRRMNLAPRGTLDLVRMREDVLDGLAAMAPLEPVDADFVHLFSSWFNRGFLELARIDWSTPANVLEKIIRYEAVHEIQGWADLRRRLQPPDRRCFAFFHPRLPEEPLIFVEVALTRDIPAAIGPLLSAERQPIEPAEATTAVFYSISNCQRGLSRISFGNLLIKQVVEELRKELPRLTSYVTLSPVPGFQAWLKHEAEAPHSNVLGSAEVEIAQRLDAAGMSDLAQQVPDLQRRMMRLAALYFLSAKTANGRPIDPVARFHLGNGARLERINWMGDETPKGMQHGAGLMVNYLYDLDSIVENHESFANHGTVQASDAVHKLLRHESRTLAPARTAQKGART